MKVYGNALRVRVCGLCWEGDNLLMVNHHGVMSGDFWAPPGGGIIFQESAETALKREFLEETGLHIRVERFLFACELLRPPLHAIELFFAVTAMSGELKKGNDPEIAIISDVRFMSPSDLSTLTKTNVHGIFRLVPSPTDLKTLTGFFRL